VRLFYVRNTTELEILDKIWIENTKIHVNFPNEEQNRGSKISGEKGLESLNNK